MGVVALTLLRNLQSFQELATCMLEVYLLLLSMCKCVCLANFSKCQSSHEKGVRN